MRKFTLLFLTAALWLPLSASAQDAEKKLAAERAAEAAATAAAAEKAKEGLPDAPPPPPPADSLATLLGKVEAGWDRESTTNRQREVEFRDKKSEQTRLLAEAKETLVAEEARSAALEAQYEQLDLDIAQLEEVLKERMGNLGELFGVVRQVAGDTRGNIEGSLVSAQLPGREGFLEKLGKSKALPAIEDLEKLWYVLQQEMTEQGRIVRFPATVVTIEGNEIEKDVIRVGAFNAVSDGRYLYYEAGVKKLAELGRQPEARHLNTVASFESAQNGASALALDPSRGAILSLLVQTPTWTEQVNQGGNIGYAIIGLGVLAGIVGFARFFIVLIVSRKVAAQQTREEIDPGNPLGRVLSVYQDNQDADAETLELKLDEAILRESSKMDRFLWAIKVVSVVAPLMGLLGTVTGMIATFQAITLFGTGDPKLMAGGISEALVTTMLGLFVAIPTTLLHALVTNYSKGVQDVLEEQSVGLVASRAEQSGAA